MYLGQHQALSLTPLGNNQPFTWTRYTRLKWTIRAALVDVVYPPLVFVSPDVHGKENWIDFLSPTFGFLSCSFSFQLNSLGERRFIYYLPSSSNGILRTIVVKIYRKKLYFVDVMKD